MVRLYSLLVSGVDSLAGAAALASPTGSDGAMSESRIVLMCLDTVLAEQPNLLLNASMVMSFMCISKNCFFSSERRGICFASKTQPF